MGRLLTSTSGARVLAILVVSVEVLAILAVRVLASELVTLAAMEDARTASET